MRPPEYLDTQEIWDVIREHIGKESTSDPIIDATLWLSTDRGRVVFRQQAMNKKIPRMRRMELPSSSLKLLWEDLNEFVPIPVNCVRVEVELHATLRLPTFTFTVIPHKKKKKKKEVSP